MAEIASAGLTPAQLALVIELSATVAAEARPIVDAAAERRRARDREYQAARRQTSADVGRVGDEPFLDKKPPRTPSKTKPIQVPPIIPQSMAAWNEVAERHGLPQIEKIAGKRRKALLEREKEHGADAVLRAIANVANSPHWLGANGWLGNFDSLMRPDNFQRMLENTYAGKAANANRTVDPKQIRLNKLALADIYDRQGREDEAAQLRKEAA